MRLPPSWRRYADLTSAEKSQIRNAYAAGDEIMAIAQRLRVYAGSIRTAADSGRWPKAKGRKSVAQRIAATLKRRPDMTNAEIAVRTGGALSYVSAVRRRLASRKGGAAG